MSLSEEQLTIWSKQAGTDSSVATYTSIKTALERHSWPAGMKHSPYLQGSYANATNIRANSDVDVVVELTSDNDAPVFYSDLTEVQKQALGLTTSRYSYADIRREVIAALQSHYGATQVDTAGANAITVAAGASRLKGDVLPCVTYRHYSGGDAAVEGVQFVNQKTGQEKINYPKVHIDNGHWKNGDSATRGWYKPTVRIFKNARERIIGDSEEMRERYPSYFVECLLYNVPNAQFGGTYRDTYVNVVNFLAESLADGRGDRFTTQNEQAFLFGTAATQWSIENARRFVDDLIALWNA